MISKKIIANNKKHILYIGRKLDVVDGGSIVSKRNLIYLKKFSNDQIVEMDVRDKNLFRKGFNILTGKPWGYSKKILAKLSDLLISVEFEYIYIDHSLLGGYAQLLSKYKIPIITFFHNVEFVYYSEKVKVDGFANKLMVWAAKQNEQKALKFSKKIICLTKRDSKSLEDIYGRRADFILPTTLADGYQYNSSPSANSHKFHLFVGSAFFANIEGICWYIENVLNRIDLDLIVVGNGMEILLKKYPNHPNLIVKGFVQDLSVYYEDALFVVNPIHKGSGMKTKTIEALMYGKTIFGTQEAFVGVDKISEANIGSICNTANEFVEAVKKFNGSKLNKFSRDYYLSNFALDRGYNNFEDFLNK